MNPLESKQNREKAASRVVRNSLLRLQEYIPGENLKRTVERATSSIMFEDDETMMSDGSNGELYNGREIADNSGNSLSAAATQESSTAGEDLVWQSLQAEEWTGSGDGLDDFCAATQTTQASQEAGFILGSLRQDRSSIETQKTSNTRSSRLDHHTDANGAAPAASKSTDTSSFPLVSNSYIAAPVSAPETSTKAVPNRGSSWSIQSLRQQRQDTDAEEEDRPSPRVIGKLPPNERPIQTVSDQQDEALIPPNDEDIPPNDISDEAVHPLCKMHSPFSGRGTQQPPWIPATLGLFCHNDPPTSSHTHQHTAHLHLCRKMLPHLLAERDWVSSSEVFVKIPPYMMMVYPAAAKV